MLAVITPPKFRDFKEHSDASDKAKFRELSSTKSTDSDPWGSGNIL